MDKIQIPKYFALIAAIIALSGCTATQPIAPTETIYVTEQPEQDSSAPGTAWKTQIDLGPSANAPDVDVSATADLLRNRLSLLGIDGEVVEQSGGHIALLLAADLNDERLERLTASHLLTFRPVYAVGSPERQSDAGADPDMALTEADMTAFQELDCTEDLANGSFEIVEPESTLVTCSTAGDAKYLLGPSRLDGSDISSVSVDPETSSEGTALSSSQVTLTFTAQGASAFSSLTAEISQRPAPANQFAITLDGLVLSAPSVESAITAGSVQIIAGSPESEEESNQLALQLRLSMLPLQMEVQGETRLD